MTKVFKKNPKRTYFGDILGPFYPNLGKNVDDYKHVKIYHATISGSFN